MRIRSKARALIENTNGWRKLAFVFSCIIVFVTAYLLIVPAFTLDKEEAAEQGGIDVPSASRDADEDNDAESVEPSARSSEKDPENVSENDSVKESENESKAETEEAPEAGSEAATSAEDLLTYEGDGFSITVDDASSVLPDATSVAVEEITSETDSEKF